MIEIRNVGKVFNIGGHQLHALKNISIEIASGEFSGFIGPSGSGKTTLLNLIGALDKPTTGRIKLMDRQLETFSPREAAAIRAKDIGFIFQSYYLLPHYSVFENVEYPLLLLKEPREQRSEAVRKALEWVGLADRASSRPSQLSGGQSQRVAIARAMVKQPKLVLADEPTANLDKENSNIILDVMEQLNRDLGTTFIFSTHDEKVIRRLRRVITLEDGQVQNEATG
ncbi:ABC transporter ATP-binding protein [Pseudobacteriovorax antillogorgiicola]|uniref:Putative ABC transport system ATP-binding protein n=1 Tax=Pseudobacteriovorax antillogorgiicola TaxID=1513793 RepID=A0A1Y6CCL2_9BACT|nr:ABC transporter ATP-binding protein [Pseudobacteriovorax antillogorgiicola]TCS48315.1 putative ABC transport system ATP-binding protein [Pseudobacteriovorax antillogorgiicola]SMF56639.1 putative ABC transport system ATP-binding protein [Pseudobacteriovorax antillogorgiicola]